MSDAADVVPGDQPCRSPASRPFWFVVGTFLIAATSLYVIELAGVAEGIGLWGIVLALLTGGAIVGRSTSSAWTAIASVLLLILSSAQLQRILVSVSSARQPPPTLGDLIVLWWFADEIGKGLAQALPEIIAFAAVGATTLAAVGVLVGWWSRAAAKANNHD